MYPSSVPQSVLAGIDMVLPVWKRSDSFLETSVYILMQHLSLLFSPEKSKMRASKVCRHTH